MPRVSPQNAQTKKAKASVKTGAKTGAKAVRPRRELTPAEARRLRRGGIAAAIALVLGGLWFSGAGGALGGLAGQLAVEQGARLGFRITDVTLTGRERTRQGDVLAALAVARDEPLLGYDTERARIRLEALPWVRRATVRRRLPDVLHVEIEERRPIALWQRDEHYVPVDAEGVAIHVDPQGDLARLPVIAGEDAPAHAAGLLRMLADEPGLYARVRAATRIGGRRWNVTLANGVTVRLPEADPALAWARLAELDHEHKLLDRAVHGVDLRLPDRLVIEPTDGARQALAPGNET